MPDSDLIRQSEDVGENNSRKPRMAFLIFFSTSSAKGLVRNLDLFMFTFVHEASLLSLRAEPNEIKLIAAASLTNGSFHLVGRRKISVGQLGSYFNDQDKMHAM